MVTTTYKILSLDQAAKNFPAILSRENDGKRSDRYVTIPTADIIDSMSENDWGIRQVMAPKVRKGSPEFSKHMIRFAPMNPDFTLPDPRGYSSGLIPEIVVTNSLNGTSSIKIAAGLLALVCTNGATVTLADFGTWNQRHLSFDPSRAFEIISEFRNNIHRVGDVISRMGRLQLDSETRKNLAMVAAMNRFDSIQESISQGDTRYMKLLEPRRAEDKGTDLWTTYNVLQENSMMGGQRIGNRVSRALNNINAVNSVNENLWDLALETLNFYENN